MTVFMVIDPGSPTVVRVTNPDGTNKDIKLSLAVLSVRKRENALDSNGDPIYDIEAAMIPRKTSQ